MLKQEETKVFSIGLPLRLEGTTGRAALVIHGFTGYPGEMYETARRLNAAGYAVSVPRLQGHATSGEDFETSRSRDWLLQVRNEYLDLRGRYGSVVVVGLSMGGVLSCLLGAEFEPEALVLLAPALAIADPAFYWTPLLKFFVKRAPGRWKPGTEDAEELRSLGAVYWSYARLPMLAELRKLQKRALARLRDIRCPVLCFVSEQDATVPLAAAELLASGLSAPLERVILKDSPHVLVAGPEKERIFADMLSWLARVGTGR